MCASAEARSYLKRETRCVKAQGSNRLASATSPYLLQHAHNPVDWYPWGDEAFASARSEDVPIFLSDRLLPHATGVT